MAFKYYKLWEKLWELNMTKEDLRKKIGISPNTMAKMGKNGNVSLDVIDKICKVLECKPEDIMEYVEK